MKQKNIYTGIKKATIEMILLKLLAEEDMYGYQLSQECKKRSNGSYAILEGSMYPILYRLEAAGHISCYERKAGRRLIRVYYHLEESGKSYLNEMIQEFHNTLHIVETLLTSTGTPERNTNESKAN